MHCSTRELAKLAGLTPQSIRNAVAKKIITPIQRTDGVTKWLLFNQEESLEALRQSRLRGRGRNNPSRINNIDPSGVAQIESSGLNKSSAMR